MSLVKIIFIATSFPPYTYNIENKRMERNKLYASQKRKYWITVKMIQKIKVLHKIENFPPTEGKQILTITT